MSIQYKKTPPGQEEENTWVNIIDEDDDDDVDVQESREPKKPCLEDDYSSVIIEAITALDNPNGSCFNDIAQFIEERYKAPRKFKFILTDMLRELIPQGKIDKARSRFKIKNEPAQLVEGRDGGEGPPQASARAFFAACCNVDPEDMESFAAEAVKDYERMTQIFKDTGSTLDVLKHIHKNRTIILNASSAQTSSYRR